MICYIYFVKCPNCDDQPFDFFDDAKSYAMGCLQNKPIITQVEICRNDFGECTDHSDLGQVWSWEDIVDVSHDEPVFTKGHIGSYNADEDPEFANVDNSVDFDVAETNFHTDSTLDAVPDNFRKPIPEGMTLEQLVEEMEENEDTVECKGCHELFDKSECTYDRDYRGWLCYSCQVGVEQHDGDNLYSSHLDDEDTLRPATTEMRQCAAEIARLLNSGAISTAEEVQAVMQKYNLD